jgi:hypothetical protein
MTRGSLAVSQVPLVVGGTILFTPLAATNGSLESIAGLVFDAEKNSEQLSMRLNLI